MINIFLILLYIYLKHEKLYLSTISYLKINKCYITNSFCCLLSLVLYCLCLAYKRPTVISQHIWVPFAASPPPPPHSGSILMEPFTVLVRDGSNISRGKKIPSGNAWNGFSTTCCTPRHGTRKVTPPRVLLGFLIFYFPPKSCRIRFHTRPKLFSRQHSIYFWRRGLETAALLEGRPTLQYLHLKVLCNVQLQFPIKLHFHTLF